MFNHGIPKEDIIFLTGRGKIRITLMTFLESALIPSINLPKCYYGQSSIMLPKKWIGKWFKERRSLSQVSFLDSKFLKQEVLNDLIHPKKTEITNKTLTIDPMLL